MRTTLASALSHAQRCRASLTVLLVFASLSGFAVTFTSNALIGVGNTTYDGTDIVVTNCTLTVDGPHGFNSLLIAAGGVVTHSFFPNGSITNSLPVSNEPHFLTSTNPATLLYSNVVLASVVVTDSTKTLVYTNNQDYLLASPDGITTQLQRTPTSTIPDGVTVFVSYTAVLAIVPSGLNLVISNNVEVAVEGAINANGNGYGGALGPGAGHSSAGSLIDGSGGGYGGNGGMSSSNAVGGPTYGNFLQPTNLGSGGGSSYAGSGGNGGGSIQITAGGAVIVNGSISANGANGTKDRSGGGSGGSIWITAQILSGVGSISANGGAGEPTHGGGGGGGRIALQYAATSFAGPITAYGAAGATSGGAGTVYTKLTGQNGLLVIDNGGRTGTNTTLAVANSTVDVVVRGNAGVIPTTSWSVGNLTVASNGLLLANSLATLTITASGNITVQPGGSVIADSAGSAPGTGRGPGGYYNDGLYRPCGGAGYGGSGGGISTQQGTFGGICYGVQNGPIDYGSGGGTFLPYSVGGSGGGAIRITSSGGVVQIDGRLSANGGNGSGSGGGGGSGGSIWLTGGTLIGSGSITVNGGNGVDSIGSGGGGGRIYLNPTANLFSGVDSAYGGSGASYGGAGTLYIQPSGQNAQLILDNGGHTGTNSILQSAQADLIVRNGAVGSATTSVSFNNLFLYPSGLLMSSLNRELPASPLNFSFSGNANVQPGSGIIADLAGYSSGQGPGAGHLGASNWCSGAGHGGFGGSSSGKSATGGSTYDSSTQPSQLGSGGGTSQGSSLGGAGGGGIHLTVTGSLQLDGAISANAGNGLGLGGGGGSGGSIYLQVGTLAGAGSIAANGGNGVDSVGGGGGGGMIYVQSTVNNYFTGSMTAYGGSGANPGGPGTIVTKTDGQNYLLTLDNGGRIGPATPLTSSSTTDLILRNGGIALASTSLTLGNLTVASSGSLILSNGQSSLTLNLASATIQPGGSIIADGTGYAAGTGPGAGRTYQSQPYFLGGGAGHGGLGGNSAQNLASGGITYDSQSQPTLPGSGGGGTISPGGAGGGAIHLVVTGVLQVDGRISANGANGSGSGGGGGSGGSIWLTAGTLAGAGSISANGGNGVDSMGGGGAGGCIALYPTANSFTGALAANGGGGANFGGAGTIYIQNYSKTPQLIVDNGGNLGASTPLQSTSSADLLFRNGGVGLVSGSLTFGNLLVASNASILVAQETGGNGITLIFSSATIQLGGSINADGAGYTNSLGGPGVGHSYPYAPNYPCSGAGHGGFGGNSTGNLASGGITYDSQSQPILAGSSGGGYANSGGGVGGGAVHLVVSGLLQLDGRLSANGLNGSGLGGGGGSGGSIWITVGTLAGTGSISANGGNGVDSIGGGGGGGCIALYPTANSFTGTLTAFGGAGANWGGAGTVYIQATSKTPQFIVDNGGNLGASTPLQSTSSADLVLRNGGIALASASLTLGNLTVASSGSLILSNGQNSLTLNLASATIQSGGSITADGTGFAAGGGQGAGRSYVSSPNYPCGGAGHSGLGGNSTGNLASGGIAYDSQSQPILPGSGGGTYSGFSTGGAGGGAIRLVITGFLQLDGRLSANGLNGSGLGGGGGSGGSIWLSAATLAGAGSIMANGGNGFDSVGGGGGGGCIALYPTANSFTGTLTAFGGAGANWGGAGTVYIQATSKTPQFIVDNGGNLGASTPLQSTISADLVLRNRGVAYQQSLPLTLNSLLIASNSFLNGSPNPGPTAPGQVNITVNSNATVQAGGGIITDAAGSAAGQGTGAGAQSTAAPNYPGGGAGYGGFGANPPSITQARGVTYGSTASPNLNGSGGGGYLNSVGGAGGGTVRLIVNGTLQNSGVISANGGNGSGLGGGGGSGGSVWLTVGTLAGSGLITANGGNGVDSIGGGGGGGRISLSYNSSFYTGTISAYGGSGVSYGGAGTIYTLSNPSQGYGLLTIDNGTHQGTNTTFDANSIDLLVRNGGAAQWPSGSWSVRNLQVRSNSVVTTIPSPSSQTMNITGNATIDFGGAISADTMGSLGGSGAGAGSSSAGIRGGGGHGGYGAANPLGYGSAYGSIQSPATAGSGGGNGSGTSAAPFGGSGGGALRLSVLGTLDIHGRVSASGGNGALNSGGGSGGSVWISATTLTGSGLISANGGAGNGSAGGGAGGRISLGYNANNFTGLITAYGGGAASVGGAGTIYTKANSQPVGQLLTDNGGGNGTNTPVSLALGAPTLAFNLTIANGAVVNSQTNFPVLSNLTVAAGGTLTAPLGQPSVLDLLVLKNVNIAPGGVLAVDGQGSSQGFGPGAGLSVNSVGSGAGYGRPGGASITAPGGPSYGSAQQPVDFGSGGGFGYGSPMGGSAGGGAVRLNVGGVLTVDGLLSAYGIPFAQDSAGGGSGGSIWVTAGILAGSGNIAADGGAGDFFGGGGGGAGGRIALYSQANAFFGNTTVAGAEGEYPGSDGTIFISNGVAPLQITSQLPTGIVSNAVGSVDLFFNGAPNPSSVTASSVSLNTPNGLLSPGLLSVSKLSSSHYLATFPSQTAIGNYSIIVTTNVLDIFGKPMPQTYAGTFAISLPVVQGRITDNHGQPVPGVLVQPDGGLSYTTTDTNGNYALGFTQGSSFTITPSQGSLIFVPSSLSYTNLTASVFNQNYMAVSSIAPSLSTVPGATNCALCWQSIPGVTYQVLCSTNLTDWTPYGSSFVGGQTLVSISIPTGPDSKKFFRVQASD